MREALWPGATGARRRQPAAGVLGITAVLLGAATCDAVDIAPAAVPGHRSERRRQRRRRPGPRLDTRRTTGSSRTSVVVANILAPALQRDGNRALP